ncbi:MAG: DinB family protein [Gemmatimonadaceae bacterium]
MHSAGASATPTDPHLRGLLDRSAEIVADTERLASSLSEEQLLWKPAPETWSVAQCFDHLITTNLHYFPGVRRAIDEGRARGRRARGAFRHSFLGAQLLKVVGPRVRARLRAPAIFKPSAAPPPTIYRDFLLQQRTLDEMIRDADGLDLRRIKVASPVTRLLRFGLGDALEIMIAHEMRHLRQAEAVSAATSR